MERNVIVSINGIKKETISVDEAKERGKEMSPLVLANTFYEEVRDIRREATKNSDSLKLDLECYIKFLQGVYDKFGNMPVLGYSHSNSCFYNCELSDIDVVKKHFTVSGNLAHQYMNIEDKEALSIFHL